MEVLQIGTVPVPVPEHPDKGVSLEERLCGERMTNISIVFRRMTTIGIVFIRMTTIGIDSGLMVMACRVVVSAGPAREKSGDCFRLSSLEIINSHCGINLLRLLISRRSLMRIRKYHPGSESEQLRIRNEFEVNCSEKQ